MRAMELMFPSLAVCLLFSILGEGGSCRNKEAERSNVPVERNDKLANGVWGGQHIRLEVTDSGGNLEYDCAQSTIDEPIILNREGNFDVKGKFTPQHGGPIRRDEENNSYPVRYTGKTKDGEMTLTITNPEKKETIGTFNLTRGSEGRLMKCR
jgi:hypothetical protein